MAEEDEDSDETKLRVMTVRVAVEGGTKQVLKMSTMTGTNY